MNNPNKKRLRRTMMSLPHSISTRYNATVTAFHKTAQVWFDFNAMNLIIAVNRIYIFPLSNNTDTSWVAPPILWCFHGPFGFSETKICIPIPLMFENM